VQLLTINELRDVDPAATLTAYARPGDYRHRSRNLLSSRTRIRAQVERLAEVQHAENVRAETLRAQHQLAPLPGATQHVWLGQ
jgi:hypothetical protein